MMLVKLFKRVAKRLMDAYWVKFSRPVKVRDGGQKKALVSYIVNPFSSFTVIAHCNYLESLCMADVLNELGYSVYVVDYRNSRKIDYSSFDLVLGFGAPFAGSFLSQAYIGKRVSYLTGANPNFSNLAEASRLRALYQRQGVFLRPRREVYWPWMYGAVNSNGIILTGNSWTRSTYEGVHDNISLVPVPYVKINVDEEFAALAEVAREKNRFIWFSGAGAVHKGLDLVLEAMSLAENDWHLDICGPIAGEQDFLKCYSGELRNHPRIVYHGFLAPGSMQLQAVMARNTFVVFPSCSEGQASSVITCMAYGLIPIVTSESAIDMPSFGLGIEQASPQGVWLAMSKASTLPAIEIERQSRAATVHVRENNSTAAFKEAFRAAILKVC